MYPSYSFSIPQASQGSASTLCHAKAQACGARTVSRRDLAEIQGPFFVFLKIWQTKSLPSRELTVVAGRVCRVKHVVSCCCCCFHVRLLLVWLGALTPSIHEQKDAGKAHAACRNAYVNMFLLHHGFDLDTVKSVGLRKSGEKERFVFATGDDGRHWMCSAFVSEGDGLWSGEMWSRHMQKWWTIWFQTPLCSQDTSFQPYIWGRFCVLWPTSFINNKTTWNLKPPCNRYCSIDLSRKYASQVEYKVFSDAHSLCHIDSFFLELFNRCSFKTNCFPTKKRQVYHLWGNKKADWSWKFKPATLPNTTPPTWNKIFKGFLTIFPFILL